MSAQGHLYNSAIFTPQHPEPRRLAEKYLTICDELDTKIVYTRGHLFKIFNLTWCGEAFEGRVDEQGLSTLPHWLAQPYFRQPMPEQTKKKGENGAPVKRDADNSAQANDDGTTSVTGDEDAGKAKKKTKKTRVIPNLYQSAGCRNMYSAACVHQRCKGCCRGHQQDINVFDCATHQIRSLQHQQNVTTSDSQQTIEATVLEAHVKNLNPVEAVSGAIASDTSADKAEQSIAA
ncbi:hypothetical protein BC939DRAFT_504484 [Gamsiella multidivaricata]|uniref:uncharacterized protein n=1 Tax=Gamsiella multidivaricata TaxID=101098 RepID=UPI00221EA5B3|nr:uncharacterized protein BC939DRAFT_504484 [Gamsiella multidivaricata]KAI7821168.1 hypothetical protein BC939DRAFT_504484 [Gamsiella multidivaricata]